MTDTTKTENFDIIESTEPTAAWQYLCKIYEDSELDDFDKFKAIREGEPIPEGFTTIASIDYFAASNTTVRYFVNKETKELVCVRGFDVIKGFIENSDYKAATKTQINKYLKDNE